MEEVHDHDHVEGSCSFNTIPHHIIYDHILPHLDGVTMAAVSAASSHLHSLSSHDHLWRDICHRTWPSTAHPLVQQFISSFPLGYRRFYADSYSALIHRRRRRPVSSQSPRTFLISAVDVRFGQETLFSKVECMDTDNKYFLYSEFLVTVLGPKEMVAISGESESESWEVEEDAEKRLSENLNLSWIIIDPESKRSGSITSRRPISVTRHWLTGEVELQYSAVFVADNRGEDLVKCAAVITCGRGEKGETWHVKEVSMKMEDTDGKMIKGKECMEILQDALERGERRGLNPEVEERKGHEEFTAMVKKRREKICRKDGVLDLAAISTVVTISIIIFFLCVFHSL